MWGPMFRTGPHWAEMDLPAFDHAFRANLPSVAGPGASSARISKLPLEPEDAAVPAVSFGSAVITGIGMKCEGRSDWPGPQRHSARKSSGSEKQ